VWVIAIAAVLLLIGVGVEFSTGGRAAPMAYGAFLDQLEAGTIANVTIRGTDRTTAAGHWLSSGSSRPGRLDCSDENVYGGLADTMWSG
jgi:hypothetical protein